MLLFVYKSVPSVSRIILQQNYKCKIKITETHPSKYTLHSFGYNSDLGTPLVPRYIQRHILHCYP